jgi:hypothetical protein
MTKPKAATPKPKLEDEAQSRRFVEMARELEASDGGLSPTDAEKAFERLLSKASPVRTRPPS